MDRKEENKLSWDFFYRQLENGKNIDETCFYFEDDPTENEHYLGYQPQFEQPYWIGYCDIEGGCGFSSAKELVEAEVFDGRSLKSRWDKTIICHIEGCCLEDWFRAFSHC